MAAVRLASLAAFGYNLAMIRILHTADWHIGQTLRGYMREHEHASAFDALVAIVAEREVNALVVAGDVFDSQNPSGEAQRLFYDLLVRLHRTRPSMTIVITAGMGDELRGMRSLSGGERFLVALALALALSALEGRQSFVDTLFFDEGFGSLDAETLAMAVDALETLQGHGRKVGVITHVAAMIDRIAVQVRVERRGNGRSTIRIVDGTLPLAS